MLLKLTTELKKFMKMRTYTELLKIPTFEERLAYLRLDGTVGVTTFGFNRYMNQRFYHSKEWKDICRLVLLRDNACDLAHADYPIFDRVYVHHMNPISEEDIVHSNTSTLLDPEFLISTSLNTHNMIHYGLSRPSSLSIERKPYDTCPWKQGR